MRAFLQYTAAGCTGLLSWWQMHLHANLGSLSVGLAVLGALTIYLMLRGMRFGYWFGMILGLGYAAEVSLRLSDEALFAASPLLGWSAALAVCSFSLLYKTREKTHKRSQYERPW